MIRGLLGRFFVGLEEDCVLGFIGDRLQVGAVFGRHLMYWADGRRLC